jgi:hypothetical protein
MRISVVCEKFSGQTSRRIFTTFFSGRAVAGAAQRRLMLLPEPYLITDTVAMFTMATYACFPLGLKATE